MNGNVFSISGRELIDYDYGTIGAGYTSGEDDLIEPYGFTWVQGGSSLTLQTDSDVYYVVNIMPSTIHSVQAYRQIENGQILITIPQSYYVVEERTSGPYTFTLIRFPKALSSIDDTLGNEIYVTLTSSVGPNTVDIMIWLINTYTDLSYDATSFNEVRQRLENYPSHFAMLERKNILTTLEEIAMQARCAIWLSNGVFYIKYLSQEQDVDLTLTESDIDAGSMVLGTTQTEELVTKLVATWTDNYALDEDHKIILRHNVKKYGTREREINFYIYNIGELVLKSATFWLIRFCNIWKMLSFDTYVNNLVMETFDTVALDFDANYIANETVKSMVTDLTYNTDNGLLNVTTWLPVKFGEMEQYVFSWPADESPDYNFPTDWEIGQEYDGSDGPGEEVVLEEITQITISGSRPGYVILDDKGDRRPSDLDDEKPYPNFPFVEFDPGEDPSRSYEYNDYPFEGAEIPPYERTPGCFPAKVLSQDEEKVYSVDVYLNGLDRDPSNKLVHQLQIDEDEVIPADSWVLVARNLLNNEAGEALAGLNEDGYEWTMQIPVWL